MTPELTPDAAKGPERIWLDPDPNHARTWSLYKIFNAPEYIPADTAANWMCVKTKGNPPKEGRYFLAYVNADTDFVRTTAGTFSHEFGWTLAHYVGEITYWLSNVPPLPKEESNPPGKE